MPKNPANKGLEWYQQLGKPKSYNPKYQQQKALKRGVSKTREYQLQGLLPGKQNCQRANWPI